MEREIVETLREWAKNASDQGVVKAVDGLRRAADEIEQLRQQLKELRGERDEARREVCKLKAWNVQERLGPEGYALLRKWDCFTRDTSEHL